MSGLWSRFVQVAADVANDLAQPEEEDNDDNDEEREEEYYEDDGNGWDESLGLDGTPSWEERPQDEAYAAGGEEEQYSYEGGVEEQQYSYEGGEKYQYEQEGDDEQPHQQDEVYGEENGWGEEEQEIDFSMEQNEQQESEQREFQERQQQQQPEQVEHACAQEPGDSADDWDLEDQDLFDEAETQQQYNPQEEAGQEQVGAEEYDNPDLDQGNENVESLENEWGNDESLNFDDSHLEEEAPVIETTGEGVEKTLSESHEEPETKPETNDGGDNNAERAAELPSGWDDSLHFDDTQEIPESQQPQGASNNYAPDQQQGDTIGEIKEEEGSVVAETDGHLFEPEQYVTAESGQNEWDESFNFDESPIKDELPVAEAASVDESGQQLQKSEAPDQLGEEGQSSSYENEAPNAHLAPETGDLCVPYKWGQGGSLDFDDSGVRDERENAVAQVDSEPIDNEHYEPAEGIVECEGKDEDITSSNAFAQPENTVAGIEAGARAASDKIGGQDLQNTNDTVAEGHEADAWNDDLAFVDHEQTPEESNDKAHDVIDHPDCSGSDLMGQGSHETYDTAMQAPQPVHDNLDLVQGDQLPSYAAETDTEDKNDFESGAPDLNLSDPRHLGNLQTDNLHEESAADGLPPQDTTLEETHNQMHRDDAWDDDLILSDNHDDEDSPDPAPEANEAAREEDATEDDAWNNDDLNLSDHQQLYPPVVEAEPSAAVEAQNYEDNGGWDNDDLNFSSQQEIAASSDQILSSNNLDPTKYETTDDDGELGGQNPVGTADEGWDNDDDLNLNSQHETSTFDKEKPEYTGDNVDRSIEVGSAGDDVQPQGAWDNDDDLNFNSYHGDIATGAQEESLQEVFSDNVKIESAKNDDAWNNADDLNFSSNHEEESDFDGEPDQSTHEEAAEKTGDTDLDNAWAGTSTTAEFPIMGEQKTGEAAVNPPFVPDSQEGQQLAAPDVVADTWNDSDLEFDDDGYDDGKAKEENNDVGEEEDGDDDSTVEQSNIGFEPATEDGRGERLSTGDDLSSTDLRFTMQGRTPSRRVTVRASNTASACISRNDSDGESEAFSEKILGTSVMFADMAVHGNYPDTSTTETGTRNDERDLANTVSTIDVSAEKIEEGTEKEDTAEVSLARDNLSSVSDNSAEVAKPLFETQISMMTLKSIADSCPSRQHDNDSDEDDERGYLPVVDKTPELSGDQRPMPELSTMTINSTAVMAHSVNDDIQRDEDMDGTYYGGSTTGEGQSNENVWEEDDASSLGGLHDLNDKIVNFEMSADAAPPENTVTAPLTTSVQQDATVSTPALDSSMAIVFTDDASVPSRDQDDDNEEDFKPVVDQIPKPLKKKLVSEKSGRTLNSMAVLADNLGDGKQDGSTTNRESGDGDDNGWDDDDLDLHDAESVEEEKSATDADTGRVVVENTPNEAGSTSGKSGGSLAAVESMENSCPSRVHDSDEEVYGLVVDQIPASPPPLVDQMSVAASSMAVVVHNVEEDLKQDEELDASDQGASALDGIEHSGWDNECRALESIITENQITKDREETHPSAGVNAEIEVGSPNDGIASSPGSDRVVDLTPKMESKRLSRLSSNSLAVLAHSINQDFEDDDEDEEDDANFGPIVDITPLPLQRPPAMTPSSTAVQATNLKEDIKQDETTAFGVGEITWEEECPELELEDMELGDGEEEATESEAQGDGQEQPTPMGRQSSQDRVVMVDHTPEGETPRKVKGDASLAVLAPSEDGTCLSINDDDDVDGIDPHGERVSYGPVVDTLPVLPAGAPNTAPSVTFSLAVEARSVDEDFKLDDEMDETFCGDTTIEGTGENVWDDQTLEELDTDQSRRRMSEASSSYKVQPSNRSNRSGPAEVMVDHTPQSDATNSRPRLADASLVALAPSVASTYRTADDSENDDDSITHEEDVYGKVVDHTPRLTSPLPLLKSNSMAVGASSADYRSEMERDEELDATCFGESADGMDGWGDDEKALEEIDTTPQPAPGVQALNEIMVDHTPVADEQPKQANIDPSVAVLAPSDDGSREEDDNDTYDGNQFYGHVVDQLPQLLPSTGDTAVSSSVATRPDGELEGTLFGDSTIGGETGAWGEDDAILDGLVAEDKADEAGETGPGRVSAQPDDSATGKPFPDATSSRDGVVLVDHTPSEIDSSAQKNSVAWLINVESGISGDETDDAGGSWRENDHVAVPEGAEEDQVVDRIPQRPESRFGDASTLVVADPSEVLSHVGDMLQEEIQDFGPVVDVTPQSRPNAQNALSAAGSTVVVAPTIPLDDLDDADPDDTVNAEGENGWDHDPSELEQAPNPQSGNEEETTRVREQVVDFLPPQEEETATDQNRDGWSEVATGAAPSVLQADPKEDEFGPVVDQLPALHPSTPFSAISTASQVAPSECDALAREDETDDSKQGRGSNVVVDPLPRPFEMGLQNLDSTASLAQSLASEDEDDDGKYGPVVDHLPSIRSSLPPSRGGSTVDALATVSEVIDDDDDEEGEGDGSSSEGCGNDGWDDDLGEIDMSERNEGEARPAASESKDEQNSNQAERGMTVRFRSVVAAIFESNDHAADQERNDAREETNGQRQRASTTNNQIFHDDSENEPNAWDDDLDFDVSLNMDSDRASGHDRSMLSSPERLAQFAEADTPPATPYSRPKAAHHETNGLPPPGVTLPDLAMASTTSLQCNTCANANTVDCPCVQRILRKKEDGDDTIKIDYTKLLQTEISKRRLIEEESKDLRSQLDLLKNSKSAGEVRMETVRTLQDHVKVVEERLKDLGNDCEALRNQNQELQSLLNEARAAASEWEERQKQWTSRESQLRQEIERTRDELEISLAEVGMNRESRETQLTAEIKEKQNLLDELSQELGDLQGECSKLRADNLSLASDLQSFRQTLADREEAIKDLRAKEAAYETEVNQMRDSIKGLEMSNSSNEDLRRQYAALEADLMSKATELDRLDSDMSALQLRVQAAEGERYKQLKDQVRISKQHEEEMHRKQEELVAAKAQLEEARLLLDKQSKDSSSKLQELDAEIQRLFSEKESLEWQLCDLQSTNEQSMNELQAAVDQKENDLQAAFEQLGSIEEQNMSLQSEVERLGSMAEHAAHLEEELRAVHSERDTLLNSVNEANEKVARLQQRIEDQGIEEGAMEARKNQEVESLVAERTNLRNTIAANKRHIEALEQKSARLTNEKQALHDEITDVKASCEMLKESAESARRAASDSAANQSEVTRKLDSLEHELAKLVAERDEAQRSRDTAARRIEELEFSMGSGAKESEINAGKVHELEELLSQARNQITSLIEGNLLLTNERDRYISKFEELEQAFADAMRTTEEASRLQDYNTALSNKIRAIQQEFSEQTIVLQNFEARMNALENELSSERQSSAKKDDAMTELRRELDLTRANLEQSADGASMLPNRIAELEAVIARFEAERKKLEDALAFYESKEHESQEDRDKAMTERDRLSEENEEMLVQFGVLNERLESYSDQIKELQELVQRYEATSKVAEGQLLELQQRLVSAEHHRQENGEHHAAATAEEEETELNSLRQDQNKLINEINELTRANAEKDGEIYRIQTEFESVKSQLGELERIREESAEIARENEDLRSVIDDLQSQRNEFDATRANQALEISRLQNEFDDVQRASFTLQSRVGVLEGACSAREQALEQKEAEMRDLVKRLHKASGDSSQSTQEMLSLRDRINQMENCARESSSQMHELAANYEKSQGELADTREKLSSLVATVEELEQELISKDEALRQQSEGDESKLSLLENKLQNKSREVADLTRQNAALSSEIDSVRSSLEGEQSRVLAANQIVATEIESLKNQVAMLQRELETAKAGSVELQSSHETEINDLKHSLAKKDGEVMRLKHRIQSLSKDLENSQKEAHSKQNALEQVTAERDESQKQQQTIHRVGSISAAQLLQQSKENAEDVENLRSTIISLAGALETSESRRADAIDRLLNERETYADSLRRLGDSVKRFYRSLVDDK